MSTAVAVIWIVTLLIVAAVIVPVAVALLRRVLRAARAIEDYLSDMKDAGTMIAGHTGAVPALDATLATVAAMRPVSAVASSSGHGVRTSRASGPARRVPPRAPPARTRAAPRSG